jgi:hypothetical protein
MARTIAVSELMTIIRSLTEQDSSKFISDTELLAYIDQGHVELYGLLIEADQDYNLEFANFTTVAGTSIYQLPANFYKFRGLDVSETGLSSTSFPWEERQKFTNQSYISTTTGHNLHHCLLGNTIMILPDPGATALTMWYTPVPTRISSSTQLIDGVAGYEYYIIYSAAINITIKAEQDPAGYIALRDYQKNRISVQARKRDDVGPERVRDLRGVESGSGLYLNTIGSPSSW